MRLKAIPMAVLHPVPSGPIFPKILSVPSVPLAKMVAGAGVEPMVRVSCHLRADQLPTDKLT